MAIDAKDYLEKLPKERREAIRARAEVLIAEELSLAQLRDALEHSQVELAEKLGVQQAAVSKLERRADMYVSTLRKLIEAMGGTLDIVVQFPDRPPVHINQFRSLKRASSPSNEARPRPELVPSEAPPGPVLVPSEPPIPESGGPKRATGTTRRRGA